MSQRRDQCCGQSAVERPRCERRHARCFNRPIEAHMEPTELFVVRAIARLVDVQQRHDEAMLQRLAPDARRRLDVLRSGLRLALHDHQSEPTDVKTDGNHVGGERNVDGVFLAGGIAETRPRFRDLLYSARSAPGFRAACNCRRERP